MDCPCHYCEHRTQTCHHTGNCEEYEVYKVKVEERRKAVQDAALLDAAISSASRQRAARALRRRYHLD